MITSYEDAQRYFGRKADKNRKIYNGMLKTYFYQFMGRSRRRKPREEQWMKKIIFATGNEHKMVEVRMILDGLGLEFWQRKKQRFRQML